MLKMIMSVVMLLLATGSFIIAYRHFKNKGELLNNAYLFASEKELEKMDKEPHYKQSAVIFAIFGLVLLVAGIEMITNIGAIYIIIGLAVVAIIYAIISSTRIEGKPKCGK